MSERRLAAVEGSRRAPLAVPSEASVPLTETRQSRTETATYVESATETEPGRLVVETNIADPRGVDNSTGAATAVAICNAAVSLGGIVHVSVMEADGTSFVLFRHPSVPEDTCTEV